MKYYFKTYSIYKLDKNKNVLDDVYDGFSTIKNCHEFCKKIKLKHYAIQRITQIVDEGDYDYNTIFVK